MASGHVNRINRPNTWLHRPATRREDFPCQPGAVHTWHKATDRCSAEIWSLLERSGHRAGRLRSLPLPGILHHARGYSRRHGGRQQSMKSGDANSKDKVNWPPLASPSMLAGIRRCCQRSEF